LLDSRGILTYLYPWVGAAKTPPAENWIAMTRVRLGLTGLAFVLLAAMLAAAMLGPFGNRTGTVKQEETLATLGVAPGGDETGKAAEPPVQLESEPLVPVEPDIEPFTLETEDDLTEI
jgi:hypothetical protein